MAFGLGLLPSSICSDTRPDGESWRTLFAHVNEIPSKPGRHARPRCLSVDQRSPDCSIELYEREFAIVSYSLPPLHERAGRAGQSRAGRTRNRIDDEVGSECFGLANER